MNMRQRDVWLAVGIVCLLVGLYFAWERLSGFPHWNGLLPECSEDLRATYFAVQGYRARNAGKNPASLSKLRKTDFPPGHGTDELEYISPFGEGYGGSKCTYNPQASGDEPLIMCSDVQKDPSVAVWIRNDGQVYIGRQRMFGGLWPKHHLEYRRIGDWDCYPQGIDSGP